MNKNIFTILTFAMLALVLILSFTSVSALSAVNLRSADNFVILAKSGISTTGTTSIVGNMGVSPIDSTGITGFGLTSDSSDEFSTSSLISGKVYASDYTAPTPSILTTAVSDMETAYTDAAGRTLPDYTELYAGDITGKTLAPGLYKWGTGVLVSAGGVTISGSSADVWIFQIAQDLTVADGAIITLSGGAQAKNIFWQVAGQVTLGTTSQFKGIILSQTLIDMQTGAKLNGKAFAQTAVTLDANTVSLSSTSNPINNASTTSGSSGSSGGSSSSCTTTWDCSGWSACNDEKSYRTCVKKDSACKIDTSKPSLSKSCDDAIEQEKTKQEIIERINLRTGLNISLSENSSLGETLRVYLSNGNYAEIRVMPSEASSKARSNLNVNCEERNCTVELKEVKMNGKIRAAYEIKATKKSKLFGFINMTEKVSMYVDAETGEVLQTRKPWWTFLARDTD